MADLLKQKDIKIAQNLYTKISKNKGLFLELLDNILDLSTFIPVCMAEYGCDKFDANDVNALLLNEIDSIMTNYGMQIAKLKNNPAKQTEVNPKVWTKT